MNLYILVDCLPGNVAVLRWEISFCSCLDGRIVIIQSVMVKFLLDKARKIRK